MEIRPRLARKGGRKKEVYPTKRTMNLYFKQDRTTAPATAALYILFALVVLLGLSKVLIYDPWTELNQMEAQALALEEQQAEYQLQLRDYQDVLERYVRAAPTQEELAQVDRLEILDLIDSAVRPEAAISQVTIQGDQVLLSFSGVTLGEAAELVARLSDSPLVSQVSVDTAASAQENQSEVDVTVYFKVSAEEVAQP